MFAWKAAIPVWAALFSVTFHSSWQSQGKHNGKAVVQLPGSPEFSLESSGMDSVHSAGLGTLPWVQEFRQHNHRASGQSHTQGAKLGARDKPGAGGATTPLRVRPSCPSCCPGSPTRCPPCELPQPAWDAALGSCPTSAHCGAG